MSTRDALDATICDGLGQWAVEELPDDLDLWPRVSQRLRGRNRARTSARSAGRIALTRRAGIAVLLCAILGLSGVTMAAAASPSVRSALHSLWPFGSRSVSQGVSPTGAPLYMSPLPHFRVLYPAYIPASLGVRGIGHVLPGGLTNHNPSPFGLTYACPRTESPAECAKATTTVMQMFPPPPSSSTFFPSVVASSAQRGIESVWFGFHTPLPGGDYISIGEWRAAAYSPPVSGQTITINGWRGHVQHQGNVLRLSLQVDGTDVVTETNLSRVTVEKVLSSLQVRSMKKGSCGSFLACRGGR
jgi:hypothetical protein